MGRLRVLLAEDHPVMREQLRLLLLEAHDIELVGTVRDGWEAVRMAASERPHVVLLDIGLPHLNGIKAARRIKSSLPQTQVLVLSTHDGREYEGYLQFLVESGASGYVLKRQAGHLLVSAIRAVARGESLFPGVPARDAEH